MDEMQGEQAYAMPRKLGLNLNYMKRKKSKIFTGPAGGPTTVSAQNLA
jgi:hypothetical protein